jgi:hypothetical protein
MTRMTKSLSRLAATAAVLVAALGCDADGAKDPGQNPASPVTPIAQQQLTIGSSRTTLTVGRDDVTSTITVLALAPDFSPLPNGTDVVLTTNLGLFDGPSGTTTVTLDLVGGKATAKLYPGATEGTARVTATVNNLTASVTVTINPEPDPAPVQAAFSVIVEPTFVSEDEADDSGDDSEFLVTAKIIGDGGKPFKGGGVYFVANNLGDMASSGGAIGDTRTTNSSGEASDTLIVTDAELFAFAGSSFSVTAHFLIEGGETTRNVTISIIQGTPPPVATSVQLALLPDATVNDDGGGDSVTLRATVLDQYNAPFQGATVDFTTDLGSLSADSAVSNASGVAQVTLNLSGGDLANYGPDSFNVSASITGDTDTKTVTISRVPEPLVASFTVSTQTPCSDDAANSTVQFTDTSTGAVLTWSWDLDGDGLSGEVNGDDSNQQNPTKNYFGFPIGVPINVTVTVSDGSISDQSVVTQITPADCI